MRIKRGVFESLDLRRSKKGAYFFLIDVIIGIFIFLTTIFIISSFSIFTPSLGRIEQNMNVLEQDLFQTAIRDVSVENDHVNILRTTTNYADNLQMTIDELVFYLWLQGENQSAYYLIGNTTYWLPSNVGLNYTVNGNQVYYRDSDSVTFNKSSSKMSKRKITVLPPNATRTFNPVSSEVIIWQ